MRRLAVALGLFLCACAPGTEPFGLEFYVFPTDSGADVLVHVNGGPSDLAWVGFGLGPGSPAGVVERVHSVDARDEDGRPLEIRPLAASGYEVAVDGGPWTLSYSLDLRARPGDGIFYRSSVRTDDYLVLVGSDAWPRFYQSAQPLALSPANRPSGQVERARVTFNIPDARSDWRVMTTAATVDPHSFVLAEHPVGSVFALGAFDVDLMEPGGGLRFARNAEWQLLREQVGPMTASLRETLGAQLGAYPSARPALALLLPLPEPLQPVAGLRTAGMVRGDTVLLYASASPHRPDDRRIRSAMAVFLGHELFHLYVPSTVVVNRELSWLSEGWAMHMGRLAALEAGWISPEEALAGLEATYRRYLDLGGYRAGSLPAASVGTEAQRDLLYLRGELVFRLLDMEWARMDGPGTFESALWGRLAAAYDGGAPLTAEQVETMVADLVGPSVVRRYVRGTAALTQGTLGLGRAAGR